jgi:hypothetical protein
MEILHQLDFRVIHRLLQIPSILLIAMAFAGYLFIAMYLIAPLKVRRQQIQPMVVSFTPILLQQVPVEVASAFVAAQQLLQRSGFQHLGTVTRDVERTGQSSYASVWIHPVRKESSQLLGVLTPKAAVGVKVVTLVTFRAEFSDETAIVTSNSSSPGSFPPDPRIRPIRCPGMKDIALLHRFHQERVRRSVGKRTAVLPHLETVAGRLEWEHTHTYERLVNAGYFRLHESTWQYVPTFRGAYFMTYRLLPPFRQIQKFMRDQNANRELRRCGFGNMQTFIAGQFAAA